MGVSSAADFITVRLVIFFFTLEGQFCYLQSDTKKWELLKSPTKIEEIQEKKFIDRN